MIILLTDYTGVDLVTIARTDAEAATLITSTIDSRDNPFILGCTNSSMPSLAEHMATLEATGISGSALQAAENEWFATAGLTTYPNVVHGLLDPPAAARFAALVNRNPRPSLIEMRTLASELVSSQLPFFDWDLPRTREGYYRISGGCECAVSRAIAYSPFCDSLWMESKLPDYAQAVEFAEGVHAANAHAKLAYNLSPSFNWQRAMPAHEQETYIHRLAALGYCWQFITLGGLHTTALATDRFASAFAEHGMRAYGELVQGPEIEACIDVVKHQKWSGAEYVDEIQRMVQGGFSSTSAMGKGVTEDQFH